MFERSLPDPPAETEFDQAWNFGPADGGMTVAELVERFMRGWGIPNYPVDYVGLPNHESMTLQLDSTRANERLGWRPFLNSADTIDWTVRWYRAYLTDTKSAPALVDGQIAGFENLVTEKVARGAKWEAVVG